ncbi:MAG: hypothetical protein K2P81_15365 [Bacteriovoracaceae bacterium]|nr:hypothetical protein [Bacteriovoracaceae bacterium]
MTSEQLQIWLLKNYGAEKFKPGLERVTNFLAKELAEIKNLNPKIITIAGTNGKGECSLTLSHLAKMSQQPHVLWTSPHLLSVTERFQNLAGNIPVADLESLVLGVDSDAKRENVGLSYYEILWVAFVRWGIKQKSPLWILEVGLGGRLDAVNILDADIVALTSISRDHQEFLGPTYRSILSEKLGVCRPHKKLISSLELRYLREKVAAFTKTFSIEWMDLFESQELNSKDHFSARNRKLAAKIWIEAGFKLQELLEFSLLGRGETWNWEGIDFQFYGSHNPDGMRKLVQFLSANFYNDSKEFFHQIWVAFSDRSQSDLQVMSQMINHLGTVGSEIAFTQFNHPKAAGMKWWKEDEGSSSKFVHEWKELFEKLEKNKYQKILVTGSYYFVATIQAYLSELDPHLIKR